MDVVVAVRCLSLSCRGFLALRDVFDSWERVAGDGWGESDIAFEVIQQQQASSGEYPQVGLDWTG